MTVLVVSTQKCQKEERHLIWHSGEGSEVVTSKIYQNVGIGGSGVKPQIFTSTKHSK